MSSTLIENQIQVFLKQPLARRFIYYEWFYSSIDRCILLESSDFIHCLKEFFPNLKSSKLTRKQWNLIRKNLGKPRRCSTSFFYEERLLLENKRQQIRLLQHKKNGELSYMNTINDLPEQIPMPLVVQTLVLVHLVNYNDHTWALVTGKIDAVDSHTNTYRINFDDHGIPNLNVQDIDVMSLESSETVYVSSLLANNLSNQSFQHKTFKYDSKNEINESNQEELNGYKISKLISLAKLSDCVKAKRKLIKNLCNHNDKAEKMIEFNFDFCRSYANNILKLDKLNMNINDIFNEFCSIEENHNQKNNFPPQLNNTKLINDNQRINETSVYIDSMNSLMNLTEFNKFDHKEQHILAMISSVICQLEFSVTNDDRKSFSDFLKILERNLSQEVQRYFQKRLYKHFRLLQLIE